MSTKSRKSEPKAIEKNDPFTAMNDWMENITKLLKEGFGRQLEVLQSEIFQLKKDLDQEKERRGAIEKENCMILGEVRYLHAEIDFLSERVKNLEQENRKNDIILGNVEVSEDNDPNLLLKKLWTRRLWGKWFAMTI